MHIDKHGQYILNERDIMELYMRDSNHSMKYCLVDFEPNNELELDSYPKLIKYIDNGLSTQEYDTLNQSIWHMPEEYKNLDIAEYVLSLCKTDEQRQRVGEELLLYLDRDLFTLLQYLKYLVDTMRQHNIVWGVGRGSSVSSYVLYLLGIHRIDSMYYSLDIKEFLR
jgi:DNA polymerase III alpha subunit